MTTLSTMRALPAIGQFQDFSLHWSYQRTTPHTRAAIVGFWQRHGAINDPWLAWRRTFDVGCIALDRFGEIVGVTSVYADKLAASGSTYWMYRMFIRPDSRLLGLCTLMLNVTACELAAQFGAETGAPAGICAAIENPKLLTRGGKRILRSAGLHHIGHDAHGLELWLRKFTSA